MRIGVYRQHYAAIPRQSGELRLEIEAQRIGIDFENSPAIFGRLNDSIPIGINFFPIGELPCGGMPNHLDIGIAQGAEQSHCDLFTFLL